MNKHDKINYFFYVLVAISFKVNANLVSALELAAMIPIKSVNVADNNKLLIEAVKNQSLDDVNDLLKRGANVNSKDIDNRSALMWALIVENKDIVELLLSNGADVIYNGRSVLISAVEGQGEDMVKLLLNNNTVVKNINFQDDNGFSALMSAVFLNDISVVRLLLNIKNIAINLQDKNGISALMLAVNRENLSDADANVNQAIVVLLLKAGADATLKDKEGLSTFAYAFNAHKNIKKLLLKVDGIDVNYQDKDGRTSLMLACLDNDIDMVQSLLYVSGININLQDNEGLSAFTYANNKKNIINLLSSHKSSIKK